MITVTAVLQHLWSLQLSCYLSGGDKPSHKVYCPPKWGLSWLIKTSTFLSDYSPTINGDSYFDSAPCLSFIDGLLRGANCTAQKTKNGLRRHNSLHVESKAEQNMRKSLLVLKNSVFWFFPKRIFSQSWLGKHFFAFIKEVYQDSIRLKMSHSQFGLFYTKSHLLVSRSGEKSFLGVYEAERKDISTI